jgi:hypothetical protein
MIPWLVETSSGRNWGHLRSYSKVLHWVTDKLVYVAMEATIFQDDHRVLSFARVHISDDASTADINAVESFRISHDGENGCASIKKRTLILDDELSAMMFMVARCPPELEFETNFALGVDGGVKPSSMFGYSVSDLDEGSRTIEISETPGVVRAIRAARAIWRAWRRYSQIKKRKAVAAIEAAWLEHAYAPGGPGCARLAAAWPSFVC